MSHDTIPKALREQLRKLAKANCSGCYGEGYQTFAARNALGYVERRCECIEAPKDADEPGYGAGV